MMRSVPHSVAGLCFRRLSLPAVVVSRDGVILEATDGFLAETGVTPAGLIGQSPWVLIARHFSGLDEAAVVEATFKLSAASLARSPSAEAFRERCGNSVVAVTPVVISDDPAEAIVMVEVHRIRHQASREFGHILDAIGDPIIETDREGRMIRANEAARAMLGCEQEEILGRHVRDRVEFLRRDSLEPVPDPVELALTSRPADGLLHLNTRVGPRDVEVGVRPILARGNNVDGAVLILRDVSDRLKAEQALRDSEEHFRELVDHMGQTTWMADGHGVLYWCSRSFLDFVGMTAEEVKSGGCDPLIHPEDLAGVIEKRSHSLLSGEVYENTIRVRGTGGVYRWFYSKAIPVRDGDGNIRYWVGTDTDVTHHKNLEQEIRASDRKKGMVLATVGHELRNPLSAVRLGVDMLEAAGLAGDSTYALDMIRRNVVAMVAMLDDILEFSRISRGMVAVSKQAVDIREILKQAVEVVSQALADRRHHLSMGINIEVGPIQGDPIRLVRVFANLLTNAARYTPDGGLIRVSAWAAEGGICVKVKDNGMGIAGDDLDSIFDPYRRSDRSKHAAADGLGIGLSICRELVHLHGGRIEARSDGLGLGSEFEVWLPGWAS